MYQLCRDYACCFCSAFLSSFWPCGHISVVLIPSNGLGLIGVYCLEKSWLCYNIQWISALSESRIARELAHSDKYDVIDES
jgi:hypothetical protein